MERSCRNRAGTRYSGDAGGRRAFFQTNGDGPDDDLGTGGLLDRRSGNRWFDDYRCELHRILRYRENKLALPRHRPPSRKTVRPQSMSLCDLIHLRTGPKTLRNDLRLHLVRPVPMNLTSRLPGRENLQCRWGGCRPPSTTR